MLLTVKVSIKVLSPELSPGNTCTSFCEPALRAVVEGCYFGLPYLFVQSPRPTLCLSITNRMWRS
jgi:hypothetical protein